MFVSPLVEDTMQAADGLRRFLRAQGVERKLLHGHLPASEVLPEVALRGLRGVPPLLAVRGAHNGDSSSNRASGKQTHTFAFARRCSRGSAGARARDLAE